MDCLICFDKCTKQPHRKPVACTYCEAVACVRCVETHITSSHQDPHCFNCRRGWTYEFLETNLPKTWYMKDFRKNREQILMDRERSRLPVSQGWAERLKEAQEVYAPAAEKAYKEKALLLRQLEELNARIDKLTEEALKKHRKELDKNWYSLCENKGKMREFRRRTNNGNKLTDEDVNIYDELKRSEIKLKKERAAIMKPINEGLNPHKEQVKQIKSKLVELRDEHNRNVYMKNYYMNTTDQEFNIASERQLIERELIEQNTPGVEDRLIRRALVDSVLATVKKPGEKRTFTMKCPVPECRGFLNTQYKCGLCDRSTCPHCLNLYSEGDEEGRKHICKEEEKESVKEIKKNCRNCPSCGMSIFRIEGCNQMFCTGCNTAFDWATGRELVSNQIHNPHYSEYLRKMGLSRETDNGRPNNNGTAPGGTGFDGCDGMPTIRDFYRRYMIRHEQIRTDVKKTAGQLSSTDLTLLRDYTGYRPVVSNSLYEYYRIITEVRTLHILDVNERLGSIRDNGRINAEYLAGMITEDQWKTKLSKNEASRIVYSEVVDSYQAFVAVGRDIMMNYADQMTDFERSLDADDTRVYNAHIVTNITRKQAFYEKHGKTLEDIYNEAVKQMDMLRYIFNKKVFDLVKTYRVECMLLANDTGNYMRTIQLSYSGLKYTTLNEDGSINIEERPCPCPQSKKETSEDA